MRFATHPLAVFLGASLLAAAPGLAQDATEAPRHISVTGTAETGAAPDRASLSLGVVTEAMTAADALDANNAAVRSLIDRLKEQGIEARDLQTTGFSVQPQYVYPARDPNGTQEPPRIVGYTVSNGVTARLRDLGRLGAVLDGAVRAGANQIHGIGFDVSNADEMADAARRQAFDNARRKAELYAQAAGTTLGPVMSIRESTRADEPPHPMAMRMEAAQDAAVPVETGEQTLRVQVEVVWELGAE